MTKDQRNDFLDRLLDGNAEQPGQGAQLSETDREDAHSLKQVADLLWESAHGAPPLRKDPVAAMLGLVVDPAYTLDSQRLRQARRRVGLETGKLVARLTARGWEVSSRDVFRWETQSAADVPPALIKAIAEEIGAAADQLTAGRSNRTVDSVIAAIVELPAFQALVERWAKLQGVSQALASSELESRMLTTVYRGEPVDADRMLQSLDALLAARERADEPRHGS